ncbi:class I SAM-dependent methyltransferase [Yimella lutea]|uniref:class I SAM-dependent methyltransferase n=1 Tax=Yimella lutea TaxID=587872 RepID=UPI00114F5B6E|nr:class I SAM-dependent methyltransferase [Yimella lutea]
MTVDACGDAWAPSADLLGPAYARHAESVLGRVRFELVSSQLLEVFPRTEGHVVDMGGGFGEQAIMLAREGFRVTVCDPDPDMLAMVKSRIQPLEEALASRVVLVPDDGRRLESLGAGECDAVLLHSVLSRSDRRTRGECPIEVRRISPSDTTRRTVGSETPVSFATSANVYTGSVKGMIAGPASSVSPSCALAMRVLSRGSRKNPVRQKGQKPQWMRKMGVAKTPYDRKVKNPSGCGREPQICPEYRQDLRPSNVGLTGFEPAAP